MKIIIFFLVVAVFLMGMYGLSFLFGGSFLFVIVPALALLCGLLGWTLPRALKQINPNVWIVSGPILLIGLLVPSSSLMADRAPGPVSTLIWTTLLLLPPLALVNVAMLFTQPRTGRRQFRLGWASYFSPGHFTTCLNPRFGTIPMTRLAIFG